jgi:hypothetical protein
MTKSYPGTVCGPSPDPTTYVELAAEAFQTHRGQRIHLEPIIGADSWLSHDCVEILRDLGWVILGERGKAGYVYVRWQRPRRWMRIERVCREHVAAVALYPPSRRRRRFPGQMELEHEAGAA